VSSLFILFAISGQVTGPDPRISDCSRPRAEWLWCDDFEADRLAGYFEYDSAGGSFVRADSVGVGGSKGMRVHFASGQISAGSLKLAFGRTPQPYLRPVDDSLAMHRDLYWRVFVRLAPEWRGGGGDKLARAHSLASEGWAQSMAAHLWSGTAADADYLVIDPASGIGPSGELQTRHYNDSERMRWLGAARGSAAVFGASRVGQWACIEAHVQLDDPGEKNGVFELWVDDRLDARLDHLRWVGSFDAYGINAVFFENYWNEGSPAEQERYLDNIVVSTKRVGCGEQQTAP